MGVDWSSWRCRGQEGGRLFPTHVMEQSGLGAMQSPHILAFSHHKNKSVHSDNCGNQEGLALLWHDAWYPVL